MALAASRLGRRVGRSPQPPASLAAEPAQLQ